VCVCGEDFHSLRVDKAVGTVDKGSTVEGSTVEGSTMIGKAVNGTDNVASRVDSSDSGGSDSGRVDSSDGSSSSDGMVGNSDGSGAHMVDLLDSVGPGLMHDRLVDSLVGPDSAGDGDLGMHRHILEDGLGSMVGPDNRGRLEGGDLGGDVGVGGLCHRVGDGGDLGHHIGVGMSLSG